MPSKRYTQSAQQLISPSPWLVLVNILDDDRWGRAIFKHMNIGIPELLAAVKSLRLGALYFSSREELISRAVTEAEFLGHNYLGTEHLLLAILKNPTKDLAEVLKQFNITHEAVQTAIAELLDGVEYLQQKRMAARA